MSDPAALPQRRRHPLRDYPTVGWLTAAVLLTLVHPFVAGSDWLMVHLVLLGAMTHSAMVWSTHFTRALLHLPETPAGRSRQNGRIGLLIVGTLAVLIGVPTSLWHLTVTGAALVAAAVLWHGWDLWHALRHALPGRFHLTVRYYLAAVVALVGGAGLGAWLARGLNDELHGRVLVAHSMSMVLGWLGLTVTGTLVTLWPTMLRTRIDDRADRLARQALPVLCAGLTLLVVSSAAGWRWPALLGLVTYAAGLAWWGRALIAPVRKAPPRAFSPASVGAALGWAVVALALVAWRIATASSWEQVALGYGQVAVVVTVGFAAQLLAGALSTLIPVVLGGGPSVVRAAVGWFDRAWVWRLVVINVGLALCLLPIPSAVRVVVSTLVLIALAWFLPLLLGAIRAALAARRELLTTVAGSAAPGPERAAPSSAAAPRTAQVVAGVACVAFAITLGVAADPAAAGLSSPAGQTLTSGLQAAATPTGDTTRVTVEAHDMRYEPSSITVPAGDRLVIELVNLDPGSTHDLTFGGDLGTRRLLPEESQTLDLGVVGGSGQGWCSIVGHRQMGMVLDIVVQGGAEVANVATDAGSDSPVSQGDPVDLSLPADADFAAVPAELPPLSETRHHEVTLTIEEVELEVAPGVRQKRWTFNGSVPGPTLHGTVGDTFEVTLVNNGSTGHSIDFHAGERAPNEVMRTIPPGESLTYTFTAARAGIWMYHCSTMPMSAHIAAGMHGAVVIEPEGLPEVDRSYLLVQSEAHLDGDGRSSVAEVDATSAAADTPDAVVFNGIANQYAARPLTASVGERVRIWVLAAGPNRGTSFHVVGGQFDTVWAEGSYLLDHGAGAQGGTDGGSQVLGLNTAQGGFVELSLPEPGDYPFVTHVMADAERGARGILSVTP